MPSTIAIYAPRPAALARKMGSCQETASTCRFPAAFAGIISRTDRTTRRTHLDFLSPARAVRYDRARNSPRFRRCTTSEGEDALSLRDTINKNPMASGGVIVAV